MANTVRFNNPAYYGEFALYKEDNIVAIGTIPEIAKQRGIEIESVKYYLTDAYKNKIEREQAKLKKPAKHSKRLVLVPLDGEDDEECI